MKTAFSGAILAAVSLSWDYDSWGSFKKGEDNELDLNLSLGGNDFSKDVWGNKKQGLEFNFGKNAKNFGVYEDSDNYGGWGGIQYNDNAYGGYGLGNIGKRGWGDNNNYGDWGDNNNYGGWGDNNNYGGWGDNDNYGGWGGDYGVRGNYGRRDSYGRNDRRHGRRNDGYGGWGNKRNDWGQKDKDWGNFGGDFDAGFDGYGLNYSLGKNYDLSLDKYNLGHKNG